MAEQEKIIGIIGEKSGKSLELVQLDGSNLWELKNATESVTFDKNTAIELFELLEKALTSDGSVLIPGRDLYGNRMDQAEQISLDEEDEVTKLLKEAGVGYTDKREKGGALWVEGDHELDDIMMQLKEMGHKFTYSQKGGRVTKGKPGWFINKKK